MEVDMEEIKCCPFCGKKPRIEKQMRISEKDRGMTPTHDLEVGWEIKCDNCGTSKRAYGFTYYRLKNDGTLEIVPQNYSDEEKKKPSDKRKEVIEKWNCRF